MVLFYLYNAPSHKWLVLIAVVRARRFELGGHLPYSPDLAASDYYLFPNVKENIAGNQYRCEDESYLLLMTFFHKN